MMGIEEGTFWDEHWVLYGNQFVNKFHIKKILYLFALSATFLKRVNYSLLFFNFHSL